MRRRTAAKRFFRGLLKGLHYGLCRGSRPNGFVTRWQVELEQSEQIVTSSGDGHSTFPGIEGLATQDAVGAGVG
jgi:hypothetical protein